MKQFFVSDIENTGNKRAYKYCPNCGSSMSDGGETSRRQRCEQCHFTVFFNPYPGVTVLVVDQEKVLLGRRVSTSFMANSWCLPGGFIEFGENYLEAAHREVLEETGLHVRIESVVNVVSNFLSERLHTLVIVLLASLVSGDAVPGDDLVELRWHHLGDPLPPMAFAADAYILGEYVRGYLTGISIDPRFQMPNQ